MSQINDLFLEYALFLTDENIDVFTSEWLDSHKKKSWFEFYHDLEDHISQEVQKLSPDSFIVQECTRRKLNINKVNIANLVLSVVNKKWFESKVSCC